MNSFNYVSVIHVTCVDFGDICAARKRKRVKNFVSSIHVTLTLLFIQGDSSNTLL